MNITKAEFSYGVVKGNEPWNPRKPQIAFYGRSNAGKSTSINAIANRNGLAKSSATPGKTKQINFFTINDSIYLVDLPGYGYAKISKSEKGKIQDLIFWFMCDTHVDKRVHTIIIDAKLGLTDLDREILELVYRFNEPIIILLNKTDKLKQSEIAKTYNAVKKEVFGHVDVLLFSAKTKRGTVEFWKTVKKRLSETS